VLKEIQTLISCLNEEIKANNKSIAQPRYFFQRDVASLKEENRIKTIKKEFLQQLIAKYHNPDNTRKEDIMNELIEQQSTHKLNDITAGAFSRTFSLMKKLGYKEKPVSVNQQVSNFRKLSKSI
jgi:tRNA uridine 5-carbamoylmethylation protein Kti12